MLKQIRSCIPMINELPTKLDAFRSPSYDFKNGQRRELGRRCSVCRLRIRAASIRSNVIRARSSGVNCLRRPIDASTPQARCPSGRCAPHGHFMADQSRGYLSNRNRLTAASPMIIFLLVERVEGNHIRIIRTASTITQRRTVIGELLRGSSCRASRWCRQDRVGG